ncbi:cytochrome b [Agrobacterium sp. NPDC090273]|uniref:cytochrome b n=1 Tax=Agrobacterium sp. NPDC090273 TaxID=3363919 RepID=UPI003839EC1E
MKDKAMNMWLDSPDRYGLISRLLHWGMACLLVWQFAVILTWRVFGPADWVKSVTSFGPGHGTIGLLTIILVVIRVIWALINRGRRPERASGWSGRAAAVVHCSFYGLMFVIPALALLRAYGNGRGFMPWIPASGVRIDWMVAPANLLHGVLSWCLLVLIAGHIVMALFHQLALKDGTLARMAGSFRSAKATRRCELEIARSEGSP